MSDSHLEKVRADVADFLKARRLELNMSQQELADKTNMARATINRMEQGLFWLGMKQYLLICKAMHIMPFNETLSRHCGLFPKRN